MAEQLILKNLPFIKILPAWAQELSYKYCSKTANLYLLDNSVQSADGKILKQTHGLSTYFLYNGIRME